MKDAVIDSQKGTLIDAFLKFMLILFEKKNENLMWFIYSMSQGVLVEERGQFCSTQLVEVGGVEWVR